MTLHDYLRIFRERWAIVLAAVLVGLLAAGAVWWLRPAEYTARLTLYVSAQTADSTQSAYQGAQLSQQRVTSYVELVGSTRVTGEVVRRLGLAASPIELAEHINASSALDSVLVDVAVTDRSPQRAADIANAVGQVFGALVNELERPITPGAQPPVAVRVVEAAAVPQEPSSAGLPLLLGLGLLAGLLLGVTGALGRSATDTSVTSPDHLRELADAPNLGFVAFDAQTPKRPLTVHEDPQSPRSEAFRQLRTNLQFVDVDQPRKVVIVTSSLPAEGKSTTLANLAIALASAGHRVLAVEADLRRPTLADLFGLDRSTGLTSVLAGRIDVEQVVQHWSGGVDLLASGPLPPNPSELLGSRQMATLMAQLRDEYDTVLIDTPPLLPVTDAAAVAPASDGVILVCRYKTTKRHQLRTAVQAIRAVSVPLLGTVFTMVPASGPRAYAQYNAYYRTELPTSRSARKASPPTGLPGPRNVAPLPPPGFHRPSPRREASHTAQPTAHRRPAG